MQSKVYYPEYSSSVLKRIVGRDPPMIFSAGTIKIDPFFIASHDAPQKILFSLPGKQRSRNRQTIGKIAFSDNSCGSHIPSL